MLIKSKKNKTESDLKRKKNRTSKISEKTKQKETRKKHKSENGKTKNLFLLFFHDLQRFVATFGPPSTNKKKQNKHIPLSIGMSKLSLSGTTRVKTTHVVFSENA